MRPWGTFAQHHVKHAVPNHEATARDCQETAFSKPNLIRWDATAKCWRKSHLGPNICTPSVGSRQRAGALRPNRSPCPKIPSSSSAVHHWYPIGLHCCSTSPVLVDEDPLTLPATIIAQMISEIVGPKVTFVI